jgi:hypothetical protein
LRPDIGVRRVSEAGGNAVRIARDPVSGTLFVLVLSANVH